MNESIISPIDILAFSPHPDDVELGCGGSLILAVNQGLRVAVADLTAAEMSSRGTPGQRAAETTAAAELLGLSARVNLGLPDTQIGADPAHRLAVIELIRAARPRLVLAPHWQDRHPDHEAAGALIRDACFYAGVGKVGRGVPHRPQQVFYYMIHTPFEPSFVIDVSAVWEQRMAAVRAYASQFQPDAAGPATALSRAGFLRYVEARAITYGALIGAAYGEPFAMRGPVPLAAFPGSDDLADESGLLPAYRAVG
ncbi:MAG: N-acetyl-alpha-D-glucosaminyl L-malate deacetylase 1 [Anaerolineae bacterium]|nr:N-acetyl-alpha-D-glucosaminyl L-malate deacetylase 1 [Anaerolineae bacterium]